MEPNTSDYINRKDEYIDRLEAALERIAAPVRSDGTYNLSREACGQIARKVLSSQPAISREAR